MRDFQGSGSRSPFSQFSPSGLIIRIQPQANVFNSIPAIHIKASVLFMWVGCRRPCQRFHAYTVLYVGPVFNLRAHIWLPSIRTSACVHPGEDESTLNEHAHISHNMERSHINTNNVKRKSHDQRQRDRHTMFICPAPVFTTRGPGGGRR